MHTEHKHAHTCMHMHTCKPLNSAFMATIRANASLDMLKPALPWDTKRSFLLFGKLFVFFSQCKRQQGAGYLMNTNKLFAPFGRVSTLECELQPY